MSRTLLVSGFTPWGAHTDNPSGVIAERMDGEMISGARVHGRVLPVDLEAAWPLLREAIETNCPAAVLCLGLAAGRPVVSLERVAVNVADFHEPDDSGRTPRDLPIVGDGPDALLATFPNRAAVERLRAAGIPAAVSDTAGTYLCNAVLYRTLHHLRAARPAVPAGFMHLPFTPEQVAAEGEARPSMDLERQLRAVRMALAAVLEATSD